MSRTIPSGVQTYVATLPCSVRFTTVPLPKSIVTRGTGRSDCHAGSNFSLMTAATWSLENNTVLARRAFVQVKRWSSSPSR
jgi:hypothetical protein